MKHQNGDTIHKDREDRLGSSPSTSTPFSESDPGKVSPPLQLPLLPPGLQQMQQLLQVRPGSCPGLPPPGPLRSHQPHTDPAAAAAECKQCRGRREEGSGTAHTSAAGAAASQLCPANPHSAERQGQELSRTTALTSMLNPLLFFFLFFLLSAATAAAHLPASASSTKTYYGRHLKIFLGVFVN